MDISVTRGQALTFTNSAQPGADPAAFTWTLDAVPGELYPNFISIDTATGDITGTVPVGLAAGRYCVDIGATNGCPGGNLQRLCFIVPPVVPTGEFASTNPPVARATTGGNPLNAPVCGTYGNPPNFSPNIVNGLPVNGDTQYAFNDVWNVGGFSDINFGVNASQCVAASDQNADGTTTFYAEWNYPENPIQTGGTEVISYPALKTGAPEGISNSNHPNLPMTIGSIDSAWMGHGPRTGNIGTTHGHLAYDLRVMDQCITPLGYNNWLPFVHLELFVVMEQFDGYGAHPGGRNPAWYRGQYNIAGVDWHFYIQPGANGVDQYIWLPVNFPAPNPVDLGGLLKWAQATNGSDLTQNPINRSPLLDPTKCLTSNSLGYEIAGGSGSSTIPRAWTDINQ